MNLLELRSVTKSYRKNGATIRALDGLSLVLKPGDFVAVRGPSGCGKTTLLLSAGLMLSPDAGSVWVEDHDGYVLSPDARAALRAKWIGFVFQQFHLVPFLTLWENVLVPSMVVRSPGIEDRARSLLERFGLGGRMQHYPEELSTGEKQRTALARALLNQPKLLLADEPTGNLDPDNAKVLLDHLTEFAASGGAVLLVTHEEQAAACAKTQVRMKDGRIIP
ncbi:MAG: ABC transporter ATP-binding protein [Verrucomicrobia bacterium]|nr:ABC transporter ATP-binding protein [Verrucomicrobiota bacterium]